MIAAIVCLGFLADVKFVPTLGFATGGVVTVVVRWRGLVLLGIGH